METVFAVAGLILMSAVCLYVVVAIFGGLFAIAKAAQTFEKIENEIEDSGRERRNWKR